MKLKEKEIQNLEDKIPMIAELSGMRAYQEALSSGLSNLIVEHGKVLEIFQDGSRKFIQEVDKSVLVDSGENLKLFITKDKNLCEQYYKLRGRCFREVDEQYKARYPEESKTMQEVDYNGVETDFDRRGYTLVAVNDKGDVVAGMRLMHDVEGAYFANEVPNSIYEYKKLCKKIGIIMDDENSIIAELSALVIDHQYRGMKILNSMFEMLLLEAKNKNVKYIFGVGSKASLRNHRIIFHKIGYKCDIIIDYPWRNKAETLYPFCVYL